MFEETFAYAEANGQDMSTTAKIVVDMVEAYLDYIAGAESVCINIHTQSFNPFCL